MTNLVSIEGASELDKLLQMLPDEIAKKVVSNSLRAGARVVSSAMKSRCPIGAESHIYKYRKKVKPTGKEFNREPGFGKRQIRARLARNSELGEIAAIVGDSGISAAALAGVGPKAFYLRFLEYGWVLTSHAGRKIRHVAARPFLRPSWESTQMAALNMIGSKLGAGIEDAAARLAGPYAKSGFSSRNRFFIGR